jgi:outer membrane protein OmpA-like peptidoglycan-associated protein
MRQSYSIPRGRELLTITYHGRVFFECKSATLKPRGHAELGRVAKVINLFPDMAIHVEVRLDASAVQANSHRLHQARVLAVKDALLEQGVDPSGVHTTIHRASQMLSAEDTVSVRVIHRLMAPPFRQAQASYQNGGRYDHQVC